MTSVTAPPAGVPPLRIAIVGAGIAGIGCATALRGAGHAVTLFDKGRRAGGRVATRRVDGLQFNHGAQYATARGDGFRAVLAALQRDGAAAPWPEAGAGRWAGVPGMSALPARLADACGATFALGRHVAHLRPEDGGWVLRHLPAAEARPGQVVETGEAERFDAVLLAVPHAQATPLLRAAGHDRFARALDAVTVAPCWTLMAAFETRVEAPDVQRPTDAPLAWIAREGSRPGGDAGVPDRWVANASPAWSREWLERDAGAVAAALLASFRDMTGAGAAPLHVAAHRWRFALTERPLGEPALWDGPRRIGVCGDWCLDGRVEAAWESGSALARLVSQQRTGE